MQGFDFKTPWPDRCRARLRLSRSRVALLLLGVALAGSARRVEAQATGLLGTDSRGLNGGSPSSIAFPPSAKPSELSAPSSPGMSPMPPPASPAPTPRIIAVTPRGLASKGVSARPRVIDANVALTAQAPGTALDPLPAPVSPPAPTQANATRTELMEQGSETGKEIVVILGRTRILETNEPVSRIVVANPAIADIEIFRDQPGSRLLQLYARGFGSTQITFWNTKNRPTTYTVRVTIDTDEIGTRIRSIFPGADVKITQIGRQVILDGQVSDSKMMADVLQLVTGEIGALTSGASGTGQVTQGQGGQAQPPADANAGANPPQDSQPAPEQGQAAPQQGGDVGAGGGGDQGNRTVFIINRVRVPGPRQVLLKVRIAELNRTAIRELGVNFLDTRNDDILGSTISNVAGIAGNAGPITRSGASVPGAMTSGMGQAPSVLQPIIRNFAASATAASSTSTQLFGIFEAGQFSVFLNALRQNNLAKILAEPNLVTIDGQPARFLAGGQFPYPVPQSAAVPGGGTAITIQFAPFGALLSFLPNILANDVIRLDVEPVFSELNFGAGTSVNGTTVPGINQRSARTTVELREGQTLAIAGLLSTRTNASTTRIPGLGDLPLVGPAFSRNQIQTLETELVVLVTPELVAPVESYQVPPAPGELVKEPTDYEFYFLGRIEGKTPKNFRATVREHDPLDVMKHHQGESRFIVGPHGYAD